MIICKSFFLNISIPLFKVQKDQNRWIKEGEAKGEENDMMTWTKRKRQIIIIAILIIKNFTSRSYTVFQKSPIEGTPLLELGTRQLRK